MHLTAQDLQAALRCASELRDVRRLYSGIGVSPWLAQHYERIKTVHSAMMSASGPQNSGAEQESDHDRIGTIEAAAILGVSTRHIRRIAHDLDGHKIGNSWSFSRTAVAQYAEGKQQH